MKSRPCFSPTLTTIIRQIVCTALKVFTKPLLHLCCPCAEMIHSFCDGQEICRTRATKDKRKRSRCAANTPQQKSLMGNYEAWKGSLSKLTLSIICETNRNEVHSVSSSSAVWCPLEYTISTCYLHTLVERVWFHCASSLKYLLNTQNAFLESSDEMVWVRPASTQGCE